MRKAAAAILVVVLTAGVLLGAAAAKPRPDPQIQALRHQVAALKAQNLTAGRQLDAVRAQYNAVVPQLAQAQSQLADADAKIQQLQGSPLAAITAMSVHDVMHNVFPSLVSWFNQYTAGFSGSASQFQSGGYLSFSFTCFHCG